jgi:hypothetical protein
MAKIIDPTDLVRNTEIFIDPTVDPPKIGLEIAGNLSTDGVSLQAVYSVCKELWKTESDLIKYPFPMVAITPEQFEFQDNWIPSGSSTIELFRDGGFATISGGSTNSEYIGVITLGDVSTAQVYYSQVAGTEPVTTDVVLTGPVNQCVQIFGDADNGSFDYRSFFNIFAREESRLYDQANHTDIGVTTFTYQAYRFPLSTNDDLKITDTDANVSTITPYTDMDITYLSGNTFSGWSLSTTYPPSAVVQDAESPARWFFTVAGGLSAGDSTNLGGGSDTTVTWVPFDGEREIGSDLWYPYNIIIDADVGGTTPVATIAEIYTKIQYDLRQTVDIDEDVSTVVSGKTADILLGFVGDRLDTQPGVFIDDHLIADESNMEFYDVNGVSRKFPFVATGDINWNDNLENDVDGIFTMFFTSANGNDYGTASAIIVEDNAGLEISGSTNGTPKYSFTFDYAGNQQGGRTANTAAPITVVAIGYDTAQYVKTTGTIIESTSNAVSLVAALERNYSNP